jgi:radical SAM protein with 4Fe4S-binding SPASM domain
MSEKFCPMPFGSMHIDPNGDILVCCSDGGKMLDSQGKRYNVQTHSLSEAWNSEYYKSLRLKFLQGEQPESCQACWENELIDNSVSTRANSLGRFEIFESQRLNLNERINQAKNNQGVIDSHPVDFQVMSGNLCNLACKMCFPRYSNTWSKFYKNRGLETKDIKLHSAMANPVDVFMDFGESFDWPKTTTMTKVFAELKDNIYHINLTGGEPTLLEENIEFLEYLKDSKNIENLEVQIITNTTNINSRLLDSIRSFKKVILLSSIDGMDEIAYIQRTPSNWDQVYKNYSKIRQFLKNNPHVRHGVNSTITALNIHHIHRLWDYLSDKSELPVSVHEFGLNVVISRSQSTGLEIVPRRIIEKIKKEFSITESIKDSRVYDAMMGYFETIDWAEDDKAMLELLDSVQKLHPELDIKKIYSIYYE